MLEPLSSVDPRPSRHALVHVESYTGCAMNRLFSLVLAEKLPATEATQILADARAAADARISGELGLTRQDHSAGPEAARVVKLTSALADARPVAESAEASLRAIESVYDSAVKAGEAGDSEFADLEEVQKVARRAAQRVKVLEGEKAAAQASAAASLRAAITTKLVELKAAVDAEKTATADRLLDLARKERRNVATVNAMAAALGDRAAVLAYLDRYATGGGS